MLLFWVCFIVVVFFLVFSFCFIVTIIVHFSEGVKGSGFTCGSPQPLYGWAALGFVS